MTGLEQTARERLWEVADVLVPATETMPSLRSADPDGRWLQRAALARADIVAELVALLDKFDGVEDLELELKRLHRDDRPSFDVLATFTAGTYYLIPEVRALIGYPGQHRSPAPIDLAADELSDDVFEGAMAYEGAYRPAPD